MRSRHLLLIAGVVLLFATQGAFALTVTVNGQPLPSQPPAVMRQDRVLLPMRSVFEALGANVNWMAATQTVTGTLGNRTVTMQIGSPTAYVNDQPVPLDVPAQIINGYTYVPVRFPSEALGADVSWYPDTETVAIALAPEVPLPPPVQPPPPPQPQPRERTVSGTLSSVAANRIAVTVGNQLQVFSLTRSTVALRQGQQVPVRELTVGEPVSVTYDQAGRAVVVRTAYQTIAGTVQAKTPGEILLDTQAQPLPVSPDVKVTTPEGTATTYQQVNVGDRVEVRLDPSTHDVYAIGLLTQRGGPSITVSENTVGPLEPGDSFTVTVRAQPGSQVWVDAGDLLTNISLPEVERGVYAAEVVVPQVQYPQTAQLTAHVRTPNGRELVAVASEPITITTAVAQRP